MNNNEMELEAGFWFITSIGPSKSNSFHVAGINTCFPKGSIDSKFSWGVDDIVEERFVAHPNASQEVKDAVAKAKSVVARWRK